MKSLRHMGLAALLAMIAASGARADDLTTVLADLQKPQAHDQALQKLDKIPAGSLAAVAKAATDPALPPAIREQIDRHLDGIYARLRAARTDAAAEARKNWIKTALDDGYLNSPRQNAKWDVPALVALEHIEQDEDGFTLLQNAISAGCSNSIVETLYEIRGLQLRHLEARQAAKKLDAALKSFDDSRYPEGTKFFVRMQLLSLMASLNWPADFPSKLKLGEEVDHTFALFGAYVGQHPDAGSVDEALEVMWKAAHAANPNAAAALEKVRAAAVPLGKSAALDDIEALSLIAQGQEKFDKDGNTTAESYIYWDRARAVAEEGWEIDPLEYRCGDRILETLVSRDNGGEVDQWIRRTLLANPDDFGACMSKAWWLNAWAGKEQCLAWGRQCAKMGTPRNRIAVVLRNMHDVYSGQNGSADGSYFKDPAVWADIKMVYDKLLSDHSRAVDDRGQYLMDRAKYLEYALLCGKPQVFLTLSEQFGEEIDLETFGGKDLYAYQKRGALADLRSAGKTPAPEAAFIPLPAPKELPTVPAYGTPGQGAGRRARRWRGAPPGDAGSMP